MAQPRTSTKTQAAPPPPMALSERRRPTNPAPVAPLADDDEGLYDVEPLDGEGEEIEESTLKAKVVAVDTKQNRVPAEDLPATTLVTGMEITVRRSMPLGGMHNNTIEVRGEFGFSRPITTLEFGDKVVGAITFLDGKISNWQAEKVNKIVYGGKDRAMAAMARHAPDTLPAMYNSQPDPDAKAAPAPAPTPIRRQQ